jgi:hypothetical protein
LYVAELARVFTARSVGLLQVGPPDVTGEVHVAPAQGNPPGGLTMDAHCEELCHPSIFGGQARTRAEHPYSRHPASYSTVCKWELTCRDPRARLHRQNVFFKAMKLQATFISRAAWFHYGKGVTRRVPSGDSTADFGYRYRPDGCIDVDRRVPEADRDPPDGFPTDNRQ